MRPANRRRSSPRRHPPRTQPIRLVSQACSASRPVWAPCSQVFAFQLPIAAGTDPPLRSLRIPSPPSSPRAAPRRLAQERDPRHFLHRHLVGSHRRTVSHLGTQGERDGAVRGRRGARAGGMEGERGRDRERAQFGVSDCEPGKRDCSCVPVGVRGESFVLWSVRALIWGEQTRAQAIVVTAFIPLFINEARLPTLFHKLGAYPQKSSSSPAPTSATHRPTRPPAAPP